MSATAGGIGFLVLTAKRDSLRLVKLSVAEPGLFGRLRAFEIHSPLAVIVKKVVSKFVISRESCVQAFKVKISDLKMSQISYPKL